MPDPKVEIVGIRELRLGEVLTMSYPGQPVLGTKQVVPMFLETMDPKTGEKVELKLALSMEQLAELQARAAKASTGTEYIGRLQFFGPLRVGDSGLSTNIYKPLALACPIARNVNQSLTLVVCFFPARTFSLFQQLLTNGGFGVVSMIQDIGE